MFERPGAPLLLLLPELLHELRHQLLGLALPLLLLLQLRLGAISLEPPLLLLGLELGRDEVELLREG